METNLLIVFGKPGAGKSFIAEILENNFGYYSFNGDDALPQDMKNALFQKENITENMRQTFLTNMISELQKLVLHHKKIVVHQTFLREYMRIEVQNIFPNATWILVECDDAVREARYLKRNYFNLGIEYLRQMTSLFEAPHILHKTLYNNKEGTKEIAGQVLSML